MQERQLAPTRTQAWRACAGGFNLFGIAPKIGDVDVADALLSVQVTLANSYAAANLRRAATGAYFDLQPLQAWKLSVVVRLRLPSLSLPLPPPPMQPVRLLVTPTKLGGFGYHRQKKSLNCCV